MLPLENSEVADWLAHAEEDALTARLVSPHGLHAIVGFHCQQAAEKWLKGLTVACGLVPPRTHVLSLLLGQLRAAGVELSELDVACSELTPWATVSRYPGHGDLTAEDAQNALDHAVEVRTAVHKALTALG